MKDKLDGEARRAALRSLDGWEEARGGDAIAKTFRFGDFMTAMDFMARVAVHADEADHHPEWSNVYNRVEVTLTSHDVGGVSGRDLDLARVMDRAFRHGAGTG